MPAVRNAIHANRVRTNDASMEFDSEETDMEYARIQEDAEVSQLRFDYRSFAEREQALW